MTVPFCADGEHVATGTGTSQRVPLHALALKDDNNQVE
jgi:hypothetical protein